MKDLDLDPAQETRAYLLDKAIEDGADLPSAVAVACAAWRFMSARLAGWLYRRVASRVMRRAPALPGRTVPAAARLPKPEDVPPRRREADSRPAPEPGAKTLQGQVLELTRSGFKPAEIAERLDKPVQQIYATQSALRTKGLLPRRDSGESRPRATRENPFKGPATAGRDVTADLMGDPPSGRGAP